jgi:hypothetical protein
MRAGLVNMLRFVVLLQLISCAENRGNISVRTEQHISSELTGSVIMLVIEGQFVCSGTVVSQKLVLTAGHCSNGFSRLEFIDKNEQAHESQMFHLPEQYKFSPNNDFIEFDLSLIEFADGALSAYVPVKIDVTSPRSKDQKVFMAGWGDNEYFAENGKIQSRGGGQLRIGGNIISGFKSNLIETVGKASEEFNLVPSQQESSLGGGDSGGPLLNADGNLIGVASAGQLFNDNGVPKVSSIFVNLSTDSSREFLSKYFSDM